MGRNPRLPGTVPELLVLLDANTVALEALPRGDTGRWPLHTERRMLRYKLQMLGAWPQNANVEPVREKGPEKRGRGKLAPPLSSPEQRWDPATGRCLRCGGHVTVNYEDVWCPGCGVVGYVRAPALVARGGVRDGG